MVIKVTIGEDSISTGGTPGSAPSGADGEVIDAEYEEHK